MDEIARDLRRVRRHLAQTERRIANSELSGRVTHVDAAKRKCRVQIGTTADGQPVLSPWVSWAEASNGFTSEHVPMRVGDQVSVRSKSGVLGAGSIAERLAYSGDRPAPSAAADAAVSKTGSVTITRREDGLEIAAGGTTFAFSKAGFRQTGGTIEHDGHAIDRTHTHTDVEPGGGLSGPPV